jgi:hypothetical protein
VGALGAITYADAGTLDRVMERLVHVAVDPGDRRAAAVTVDALRSVIEQLPSGVPAARA